MTVSIPAGVPALRALSIGEILDAAFVLYRRHFGPLATVVLVCSLLPLALGAYIMAVGNMWTMIPLVVVYVLAMIVLGSVATGATVFIVSESYLGRAISAGTAFHRTTPLLGRLVACSFLFGVVVVIGFMFLLVPGVILGCGLILAIPAVVLEPDLQPASALSRSWGLTRGSKWRMFGLLLTSLILVYIPATAIEGMASLAGADDWLAQVLSSLVQIFLYPFFYCVLTVTYYDLRVRREGFDLELLATSLRST